jgi:hypothetical protein
VYAYTVREKSLEFRVAEDVSASGSGLSAYPWHGARPSTTAAEAPTAARRQTIAAPVGKS